jgi:hypothetical protein
MVNQGISNTFMFCNELVISIDMNKGIILSSKIRNIFTKLLGP